MKKTLTSEFIHTQPSAQSTLTSKGQITIPKLIRDFLGLTSGEALDFFYGPDDSVIITKHIKEVSQDLKGTDKGAELSKILEQYSEEEIENAKKNQETIDWGTVGDELL